MSIVAVTGASGFIGHSLLGSLKDHGHTAVGMFRGEAKPPHHAVGDINAMTDWSQSLCDVEVVIHCAARVHVMQEKAPDPLTLYRAVNVEGSRRLAEQAASSGVRRLIFLSSVKAVAERSSAGCRLQVIETPKPEDAYGLSKLEAEHALLEVGSRTGLEIVIVRSPLVYGPGVKGNFLRLLRHVYRGLPLPLGAIDNARSMVYLGNLLDFLCTCIAPSTAAGRTFFVADCETLSTTALIQKLGKLMNCPARLVAVPPAMLIMIGHLIRKEKEIDRLLGTLQVSITSNYELLGWVPPYSVEDGLFETVQWFTSQS